MKNNNLRRTQLDHFFSQIKELNLARPKLGWVREVRTALSMSMQDLANRSDTIKQRINRIEKDEITGKVTIETLQKVAIAMDCEFIYFVVPKTSLEEVVETQVQRVAERIAKQVEKSMQLEKQGTSAQAQKETVKNIKHKILSDELRRIWKKK